MLVAKETKDMEKKGKEWQKMMQQKHRPFEGYDNRLEREKLILEKAWVIVSAKSFYLYIVLVDN